MKVALVDPVNTIPSYVKSLGNALQRCGAEVMLFSGVYHRDSEYHLNQLYRWEGPRQNLRRGNKAEKLIESRAVWRKLLNAIDGKKLDLVHIQWLPILPYAPIELRWLRWLRLKKIGIVYTVHNLLPHDRDSRYLRWVYRKAYHAVDHLIVHTRKTEDALKEVFGVDPTRISVVPHGVEAPHIESSKEASRQKLNLPQDVIVLLLFGVIRPYKGTLEFLDAFDRIRRALPRARLLIAGSGSGEYLKRIEDRIEELNLAPFVIKRIGYVEEDVVPHYFYSADLAVFPYLEIDQSGALMTAFAHRVPVLATALKAFRETISHGETGLLVPPGRIDLLADVAIEALRNRDRLLRLGENGYRFMLEHCSWEQVARQTLAVYERVKEFAGT